MSKSLRAARNITAEAIGALPVPLELYQLKGNTATCIKRPDASKKVLVLDCEAGSFRVRPGDYSGGLTFADADVSTVTNLVHSVGHGFLQGDGPFKLSTTGAVPTGLDTTTEYFLEVADADHYGFATVFDTQYKSTDLVDITAAGGGGTHTVNAFPATGASETDGYGSFKVRVDKLMVLAAPDEFTALGSGATDLLTYWFLPG
jgi:hypothetical protein